jgi:putative oxidoreductase
MKQVKSFLWGKPFPELKGVNIGLLLIRLYGGFAMAFGHGLRKMPPSEGFINGTAEMGFPFPSFFAWMAAFSEFGGGILIAIGLFARPSSFFLGMTMLVAAFIRHGADPFGRQELALFYLVFALLIFFTGPGKYSIDQYIGKKLKS